MVLTMRDLFKCIEENKFDKKYQISITYLEVYNETIRDLFIPNSSPLKLCEDPDKGVCVSGLTEKFPKTPEEVYLLIFPIISIHIYKRFLNYLNMVIQIEFKLLLQLMLFHLVHMLVIFF